MFLPTWSTFDQERETLSELKGIASKTKTKKQTKNKGIASMHTKDPLFSTRIPSLKLPHKKMFGKYISENKDLVSRTYKTEL